MFKPVCLVIDPALMVAEVVAQFLEARGYEPHVASTYECAERLLQQGPRPALIVSHFTMPHQPAGPTLLERAMLAMPSVPVVVISSNAQAWLPGTEGRWVYLAKPFGMAELGDAIVRARAAVGDET